MWCGESEEEEEEEERMEDEKNPTELVFGVEKELATESRKNRLSNLRASPVGTSAAGAAFWIVDKRYIRSEIQHSILNSRLLCGPVFWG
ncbi:hypothetical protein AJ78_01666 [Emergomyces pasteurianus Ep9510]|uniref:Uncharacterized protein n=1 Tax=Emergomyces pasteurianus Ep9510 TaxID=1447872 RepID=A0A1J9PQW2_9EURO|nr:hypothetical protein AJ78_01666 [Emergomyces pasteurianus Ep9510]